MKASFVVLSLVSLALSASSCEKEDTQTSCAPEKTVVKEVVDAEGIVIFNSEMNKYLIYSSKPGAIDLVDIGVVCGTIPEGLQVAGKEIVFSGAYKAYDTPQVSPAGHTYYYLQLSKAAPKGGK